VSKPSACLLEKQGVSFREGHMIKKNPGIKSGLKSGLKTKTCVICGREKALCLYSVYPHQVDGRDTRCKRCMAEISRGRRNFQTSESVRTRIKERGIR
jgi:hypothetical protein